MANNRSINITTVKRLYANSGGICTMPGCTRRLFPLNNGYNSSEIAHIEGVNPGSARYNSELSEEQINDYDNLILLCPTHHSEIDSKENLQIYTVEYLKQIKHMHEISVENQRIEESLFRPPINVSVIKTKKIEDLYNQVFYKQVGKIEILSAVKLILDQSQYTRWVLFKILEQCIEEKKCNINMPLVWNRAGIDFENMAFQLQMLSEMGFIKDEKFIGGSESYIEGEDGLVHIVTNDYEYKLVNGDWYLKKQGKIVFVIYYLMNNINIFFDFLVNADLSYWNK